MKNNIVKKSVLSLSAALIGLGSVSCGNYNSAAKNDAATGAILGAGAGAIIGNQSGSATEGAAIGAALGGLGGYAVGNEKDKR
ncbi:glycine zipper domain-containing protein [bacterium]|nr:glycine zipper domain-containing protein [bacterium]